MTNWADRKKDFNGCGLPVVTLPDGSQLAESIPTSIYYGKKFGQYPRDPAVAHTMESLLTAFPEVFGALGAAHFSKDNNKIASSINEKADAYIAKLEPILKKSKFLCGDTLTVVDFWVGAMYCDLATNAANDNKVTLATWAAVLRKYPNFKRFGEDFKRENADWLNKRAPHAV